MSIILKSTIAVIISTVMVATSISISWNDINNETESIKSSTYSSSNQINEFEDEQVDLVEDTDIKNPEVPQNTGRYEPTYQPYFDIPLAYDVQDYLFQEAAIHSIAPELVIAIIQVESNYVINAKGDKGRSKGLMQIQERWHIDRMDRLGCTNLLNAKQNIRVGIDILSELLEKYEGDIEYVLMCYNGGESYARKNISKGITSTEYTRKVLGIMEELQSGQ